MKKKPIFKWEQRDTKKVTEFSKWYKKQTEITYFGDYGEFLRDLNEKISN